MKSSVRHWAMCTGALFSSCPRVHDGSRRTQFSSVTRSPSGLRAAELKELTVVNMWGLAIAIGFIVVVTVIMGLIATHGSYEKPRH